MKTTRYSETQIFKILKEAEAGTPALPPNEGARSTRGWLLLNKWKRIYLLFGSPRPARAIIFLRRNICQYVDDSGTMCRWSHYVTVTD